MMTEEPAMRLDEKFLFVMGRTAEKRQEARFVVPAGLRRLTLRHNLDAGSGLALPVLVRVTDPAGRVRLWKQLGYGEPVIGIGTGATDTTNGAVPGEVCAGEWLLQIFLLQDRMALLPADKEILFVITVSGDETPLTEMIGGSVWTDGDLCCRRFNTEKIHRSCGGWYKGDLHGRTRLSDGADTPQNASRKAVMMELDYYVPTERNVLPTGWPKTPVMVLPGMEVSTPLGHMNLFGVDRIPRAMEQILTDRSEAGAAENIEDVLDECKNRGWLRSIDHPFLPNHEWQYGNFALPDLDCLEILHNPTLADSDPQVRSANEKAIRLADLLWEDGYRICAVGGSGSHRMIDDYYPGADEPPVPGDPATYLYMDHLSPASLIEALRGCRAYVSRHCTLRTNLKFGTQLPEEASVLEYELLLGGCERRPDIFYRINGETVPCEGLTKEARGWRTEGRIYLDAQAPYICIRFGAQEKNGDFLFYANPITRGSRYHRFITFSDAADCL